MLFSGVQKSLSPADIV